MADLYDELTATWLKERYLLGVDLTLDDGTAYPDSIYDHALRSAVAHIEHDLGISINTVPIKNEQHDAIDQNRLAWWPFRLDFRPVQKVTKLLIQYGSFAPVDIPVSWVQLVSPTHGQIHLIPSEEQLGSYMFRAGIPLISGDIFQPASYVPGYFRFDYTTGFEFLEETVTLPSGATEVAVSFASDVAVATYGTTVTYTDQQGGGALFTSVKTHSGFTIKASSAPTADATISWKISTVEEDLKAAIGMVAALLPLDVAGDLIAGAGIATISTSMDSLSQSLGTTSSATNSGYGARVLQLERQLKSFMPALRAKYKQIQVAAI